MKEILLIGLGGGVGAICRFLLSRTIQLSLGTLFPVGTLLVNVLGSFLIGLLSVLIFNRFPIWGAELRALLLIGLLGGFTTFSTFSLEALELWENGEGIKMILYLGLSVMLGLFAAYGGILLGRKG